MPRAVQVRELKALSLPAAPLCLIHDQIPLPERYSPPLWAVELVQEWGRDADLRAAGAYPTQSVLLQGPSGVGKTTSARWIAGKLKVPLLSLSLANVIESYIGSTGRNIESALKFCSNNPSILLADELDAISAPRDKKESDVGEIWRITNTFIQELDRWHSAPTRSLLIATTNMAESIDYAIRRRFESEVAIPLPTVQELSKMAGVPIPDGTQMSHATMRKCILMARRAQVLKGIDYATGLMTFVAGHVGASTASQTP